MGTSIKIRMTAAAVLALLALLGVPAGVFAQTETPTPTQTATPSPTPPPTETPAPGAHIEYVTTPSGRTAEIAYTVTAGEIFLGGIGLLLWFLMAFQLLVEISRLNSAR